MDGRSRTSGRSRQVRAQTGNCCAAPNRLRCSAVATVATPGTWCLASRTTSTPGSGNRARVACACTRIHIRDGKRLHIGISTGGHYLSEDGGETFTASNGGVGAGFTPDPYPVFGQCVHKIARHDAAPGRLQSRTTAAGPSGMARAGAGRALASCAATTTAARGDRSPRACRRTSVFQSWSIRANPRHSVRRAPRASRRAPVRWRACGLAQRKRRCLVDAAVARAPEERELLHGAARRHGDRRPAVTGPLLRHDDRSTLDRTRRWRAVGVPVPTQLPPIHNVRVALV